MFPLESMPGVLQVVANLIPMTWMIDTARGVILRGAGWADLWVNAAVLSGMAVAIVGLAASQYRKRVS